MEDTNVAINVNDAPTTEETMPEALPFAHPFFTNVQPSKRRPHTRTNGRTRLREQVKDLLEPIPDITEDPVWTLADVIGQGRAKQIETSGGIQFHAVGDTGAGKYPIAKGSSELHFGELSNDVEDAQIAIAENMNQDLNPSNPGGSPAFFLHLGDVIYFDNTPGGYHEQFYWPYKVYGGKIIAIPGNHDGEVILGHQPSTLYEFVKNFCPRVPSIPPDASPIIREMSAQPSVYWWLQAPYLDLVGLYSNVAEGPGYIRGSIPGEHQYTWFNTVLKRISDSRHGNGARKAFVVAVHHPPVTAKLFDPNDEGHAPSDEMSADLDKAFNDNGVWPDAVLSAHVHNYQHITRFVPLGAATKSIPYLIAGGGGRIPQSVLDGAGQQHSDFQFEKSHQGHGYLLVSASASELRIAYNPVPGPDPQNADEVVVSLQ